ncbi:glutaminyl-peptide cyclotransferase [uncultured Paludibaculum sp.]|uniref:glutaminyl-peptide cyclotransferase n=1 Tax=uncultured Paludibaculum sp. TaxID=1765020 RepID=UPI002AAB078A|nr:glutaminyl-peptide cyclotransferase [uncultured Paludibaculum sp.]
MSKGFAIVATAVMIIGGAIAVLVDLTGTPTLPPAVPLSPDPAPMRAYEVVAEYPHDPRALTQGLVYANGFLYESVDVQGHASVRKVDLETGRVLEEHAVESRFLGEGVTEWRGQIVQLTPTRTRPSVFRSLIVDNLKRMGAPFVPQDSGVRYDLDSLEPVSTFGYNTEGWGLTHDDHQFIKSDGTSILRFLNPETMKWQAQIAVVEAGKGIRWLNELEYVDGSVYANIWQRDRIAIIQLNSGQVTGWLDLAPLRSRMIPAPKDAKELGAYGRAVANGIAYDAAGRRLFVTGKNWPRVFEIRLGR